MSAVEWHAAFFASHRQLTCTTPCILLCHTVYMSAVKWDTSRLLCSPPACTPQSIFYQPILYQGCSLGFSIKMFLCPINAFPPVRLFRWGKKKTPDEILGAAISIYCTSHELQGIFWLGGNKKINLDFLVRHSLGAVADIICCSILMCTDKASLMQAPTMRRRDRTRGLAAFFSLVSNVTSLAESFPSCGCNIYRQVKISKSHYGVHWVHPRWGCGWM